MAFAQAGDNSRIQNIRAKPALWNTLTESGPTYVTFRVTYVSLKQDYSQTDGGLTWYPNRNIEFDDRSLVIIPQIGNGWQSYLPSQESQEILQRVIINPRDAFHVTWTLAEQELSHTPEYKFTSASLLTDEKVSELYGCESVWAVEYTYNETTVVFIVDAQTGKVILIKKYH